MAIRRRHTMSSTWTIMQVVIIAWAPMRHSNMSHSSHVLVRYNVYLPTSRKKGALCFHNSTATRAWSKKTQSGLSRRQLRRPRRAGQPTPDGRAATPTPRAVAPARTKPRPPPPRPPPASARRPGPRSAPAPPAAAARRGGHSSSRLELTRNVAAGGNATI